MSTTYSNPQVLVDYKTTDYRGFLFLLHESHGLLLLYCSRKKSKGPHFQTPGGHVDEIEFLKAAQQETTREGQLRRASMMGAARELYEETGLDVRDSLHRLQPVQLHESPKPDKLENEYKHRLFYQLNVIDADFPTTGVAPMGTVGTHLKLKLSAEHQGFQFVSDAATAADMLQQHSGGKIKEALAMALALGSIVLPQAISNSPASVTPSASSLKPSASSTGSRRKKTDKRPSFDDDDRTSRAMAAPVVNLFPDPEQKSWWSCWCLDC